MGPDVTCGCRAIERGGNVRFSLLRSGSSGNCTLVEHAGHYILLDAGGMSQRALSQLITDTAVDPAKIDAVIITHLHADHCNQATMKLCGSLHIPLVVHRENAAVVNMLFKPAVVAAVDLQLYDSEWFYLSTLKAAPFKVSHDARGVTSAFRIAPCEDDTRPLLYAADLGFFSENLVDYFLDAGTIVLESNHDTQLLWQNPHRPMVHKKRVTGNYGHLSNEQAAEALVRILAKATHLPNRIVLCHLSGDHNTPELAKQVVEDALATIGLTLPVTVAPRHEPTPFFEV